ncbi:MAG TPA: glycosyltransferase family 4 protein [Polyangiaceae bacterium]|nr:glycosyltransferase family 4 protein [Polyangiaceae bacterium]
MKPRIGFALEQSLGHVAYGMSLRRALSERDDIECVWLEVPYAEGSFGRVPVIGRNWTLRGSVRARLAIARAHRDNPLDALFINTQTIGLFSAPQMRKIPTLMSLDATPRNYDELANWYGDRVHPAPVERVKLALHRSMMRHPDWFTTWSQWAKDSLVRDYGVDGNRVTILPPGTTLSNFPDPSQRAARRPGPLRLLFVGGDFRRKGGDLLLEVFHTHLRQSCELHLVTSAEIPSGNGVFVYHGVKPHSAELLRLYAESDVFVLPTRADCLAVVLGEAMASSLPIITTRVGAHAEAVEPGESGFVLDVDDARALRESIEQLARDPELARRMGRRSRQVGEERFDMQKNAHQIADLLVEIARTSKKREAA